MGYIRCPSCEQVIDSEVKKCFFCGSVLNHHMNSGQLSEQQNSHYTLKIEHPVSLTKITLIVLLSAAILGVVFFLIRYFD